VTVDAYTACVRAGQCTADHPGEWTSDGVTFGASTACNYGVGGRGRHPMNCVDWVQATAYCQAQGKRLPSEEEWEWAARGGAEGRAYPWGNNPPGPQLCWSGVTKRTSTCPVGSYPAGDAPPGIHDLAGNVWEWTSTSHENDTRVRRGGGWINDDTVSSRAGHRGRSAPTFRGDLLGFRCAQ
jgi:formylglycine-generating enzyme required for sulfatase activity